MLNDIRPEPSPEPAGMALDQVWAGLETLLRHILTGIERVNWELAKLSEPQPAPVVTAPDQSETIDAIRSLMDQRSGTFQVWCSDRLDGLQAGLAELSDLSSALLDAVATESDPVPPVPLTLEPDPGLQRLEEAFHNFATPMLGEMHRQNGRISHMSAVLETLAAARKMPDQLETPPDIRPALSEMEQRLMARMDELSQTQNSLVAGQERLAAAQAEISTRMEGAVPAPQVTRLMDVVRKIEHRLHVLPNPLDLLDKSDTRLSPWDHTAALSGLSDGLKRMETLIRNQQKQADQPTATTDLRLLLAEILAFQQRHESLTGSSEADPQSDS